jgi:hypothetical protein
MPDEDAGQLVHGAAGVGPQFGYHRVSEDRAQAAPLIAGTLRPAWDRLSDLRA